MTWLVVAMYVWGCLYMCVGGCALMWMCARRVLVCGGRGGPCHLRACSDAVERVAAIRGGAVARHSEISLNQP